MSFPTYLQNKQKKIESKYHQVAKQFESKYESIHRIVTSKFHSQSTETKFTRSKINNLIKKSTVSCESKIKSKIIIPIFLRTSTKILDNCYQENIDWTRFRFSGKIMKIIIRKGKIVE